MAEDRFETISRLDISISSITEGPIRVELQDGDVIHIETADGTIVQIYPATPEPTTDAPGKH